MASSIMEAPPPPRAAMWFALLGAPAAWAVQALIAWYVESHFCGNPIPGSFAFAPSAVRATEVSISTVAGVIGVVALLIAVDRWRDSRDPGLLRVHARSRPDFMAASAMFVSASFILAIALTGYASAMLNICQTVR